MRSKNKSLAGLSCGKENSRKILAVRLKEVTESSPELSGICLLAFVVFSFVQVRSLLER